MSQKYLKKFQKEDLNHIKEFLRSEIEDLPGLEQGSRIAVSYFTGISYQPITLSRCCNINGAEQAKGLINSLTFDSFVTDRIHDEKSHPGRQSDSADIKYAFQSIYGKDIKAKKRFLKVDTCIGQNNFSFLVYFVKVEFNLYKTFVQICQSQRKHIICKIEPNFYHCFYITLHRILSFS